jgi:hypothetical protein
MIIANWENVVAGWEEDMILFFYLPELLPHGACWY